MTHLLSRARSVSEVAAAISGSDELDIERLPLQTIEAVVRYLSVPSFGAHADVAAQINHLDAQKKVLIALPNAGSLFEREIYIISCYMYKKKRGERGGFEVCERKNMSFQWTLDIIAARLSPSEGPLV